MMSFGTVWWLVFCVFVPNIKAVIQELETASTVSPGKCPTLSCSSHNGTIICLGSTQLCDFIPDCQSGADEANCGDCDFDAGGTSCGWKASGHNENFAFQVLVASTAASFLPHADAHQNVNGFYLAMVSRTGQKTPSSYLIFESPSINVASPRTCKLQFAYYSSSTANSLSVLDSASRSVFFTTEKRAITHWQTFVVDVGRQSSGFRLQFWIYSNFYSESSPWKDLAVDNLKLVDCDPYKTVLDQWMNVSSLTCDFERDLCGWDVLADRSGHRSNWQRTDDPGRAPGNDHTSRLRPTPTRSGTWLTTQNLVARETDLLATSFPLKAGQPYCLSFWYYFKEADDRGSYFALQASRAPNSSESFSSILARDIVQLWTTANIEAHNWQQRFVDIPPQAADFYLIFRADVTADTIAGLDDIGFRNGSCKSGLIGEPDGTTGSTSSPAILGADSHWDVIAGAVLTPLVLVVGVAFAYYAYRRHQKRTRLAENMSVPLSMRTLKQQTDDNEFETIPL